MENDPQVSIDLAFDAPTTYLPTQFILMLRKFKVVELIRFNIMTSFYYNLSLMAYIFCIWRFRESLDCQAVNPSYVSWLTDMSDSLTKPPYTKII